MGDEGDKIRDRIIKVTVKYAIVLNVFDHLPAGAGLPLQFRLSFVSICPRSRSRMQHALRSDG